MGEWSVIADRVDCYNVGEIKIGSYTTVSQDAVLCSATHDETLLHFPLVITDVTLGDYVWICAEAFLMPGVKISNGAVIGVRSTVTKDIPEWKIAAGTPCRVIRDRDIRLDSEPLQK